MNEETKISISKEEFEALKKEVTELKATVNFLLGVHEGEKLKNRHY